MKKRVVVITGASRGIGKACAEQLANSDTHLILIATSLENLAAVSEACIQKGASVQNVALDLSNTEVIKHTMSTTLDTVSCIDILINNAGIWIEKNFLDGDMEAWDHALDTNLKGVIHMTRYCLDKMKEGSSAIFIGSTASRKTYAGGTNYCAAKFGLLGFANSLFEDIRHKSIKVSTILPGVVNTDMHKGDPSLNESEMIQPEDVAQTVNFVIQMPKNVCPTEIVLMPQKNPKSYK